MDELIGDPALLSRFDAIASDPAATLAISKLRPEGVDIPRLLERLAHLRHRFPLVLMLLPAHLHAEKRILADLDGSLAVVEEADPLLDTVDPSIETVLLRHNGGTFLPSALATLRATRKRNLIRVVPMPGSGPRMAAGSGWREPGASVGWLARHITRKKVGLALGAGGAKGFAHIGVAEELASMRIPIDYVAGSSIGAPVAAGIGLGLPAQELTRLLTDVFQHAIRPTFPLHSFLSSSSLAKALRRVTRSRRFEQMRLPVAIVAVDLFRREEVIFTAGNVTDAIMASTAIPGIFRPVLLGGRVLVDGGLLDPVPITTVAGMGADVVLGVRLSKPALPSMERERRGRLAMPSLPIADTIQQAFEVMQWKVTVDTASRADVVIEPEFVGHTGLRDFRRALEFAESGRQAVQRARPALREHLPWVR